MDKRRRLIYLVGVLLGMEDEQESGVADKLVNKSEIFRVYHDYWILRSQ